MSLRGDNGSLQRNRRSDRAPARRNTYDLRRNNRPASPPLVRPPFYNDESSCELVVEECAVNYTFAYRVPGQVEYSADQN